MVAREELVGCRELTLGCETHNFPELAGVKSGENAFSMQSRQQRKQEG